MRARQDISGHDAVEAALEAERAELNAVLSSEIFQRAPTLAQLLSYVCGKYFSGQSGQIKEYSIAVEAFGRPADFDQKKDSIVRVEAHRLRKRLREYYETEGRDHEIRIELPLGTYVPQFTRRQSQAPGGLRVQEADPAETEPGAEPRRPQERNSPGFWRGRHPRLAWVAAAIAVPGLLATWLILLHEKPHEGNRRTLSTASQPPDLAAAAALGEVRIAAGSTSPVRDRDGQIWIPDQYFQGGRAVSRPGLEVAGTLTPELFRSWREGEFRYELPLKAGVYELTLWFCEPHFRSGSDNSRSFRIRINGETAVEEFDIIAEAGTGQAVTARTWRDVHPGEDGLLRVEFEPISGPALVSAVSVLPGTPGRLRPIRIAAREQSYTDSEGRIWSTDRFFSGGRLVRRTELIQGTEDPELYRGERYGRLTYSIPVPPESSYMAVFHFAETWFGSRTGGGGAGSRLFDILCNGLLLERNLDVYREAGGPFRILKRTYRGLKPTPNGRLVFQLVPSRNYAFLNALEILDESGAAGDAGSQKATERRLSDW